MGSSPPGPTGSNNNPLIDQGTMCLNESSPPGPMCSQSQSAHRDELTPIADYMAGEMNSNAHGDDATKMAGLNGYSADECIADYTKLPLWKQFVRSVFGMDPQECVKQQMTFRAAALAAWGLKVRQGGDWDHKPKIAIRFHPRVPDGPQHWHLYGNTLYFYDVWSNLHYGYVGRAAGFSESDLLDGAGLEQVGSTLLRLGRPQKSPDVEGLRAWDDPPDRAAIEMGIALHQRKPDAVTAQDLMNLVLCSNSIRTKPYSP